MSRIYFHSKNGEVAELHGSERAYAGCLTNRLALAALNPDGYGMREKLLPLIPADSFLHHTKSEFLENVFTTWWSTNMGGTTLTIDDVVLNPWLLTLNTMIMMGSDAIELLARMHATCEIHGYVEGEHREWLAEIIDEGISDKVLRKGQGWNEVSNLLKRCDRYPIVMSYSVCESFPNYYHLMPPWPDGVPVEYSALSDAQRNERENVQAEIEAKWYDEWSFEQKWESAMIALRETGVGNVDLNPEMWGIRGFGDPMWSVFDLIDRLNS